MKRSEIVERIYYLLLNSEFVDVPNSSYINEGKLAEQLLQMLEDSGMQPPNITIDQLLPNSGLTTESKHYYACWEPE